MSTEPVILAKVEVLEPDEWQEAKKWARAASQFEKGKLAAQVMAGFALEELRSKWNRMGKKTTSLSTLRGWQDRVKQEIGISHVTALNWIAMAEACGKRLKKQQVDGKAAFTELMDRPIHDWTDAQVETVTVAVQKLTDGRTQLDFMQELGLTKPAPKPRGGKREKSADSDVPAEDSPELAALDICKPIMQDIYLQWIDKTIYERLPEVGEISQRALVELSNQLHAKLAPLRKKFSR